MTFFDVVLKTRGSLHPGEEAADFISEYTGYIECESGGSDRRVGKAHAYLIRAGLAARHHVPVLEACDAHSQQLRDCCAALFDPRSNHFKEEVIDRFDALEPDCLLFDYVVLHPRWRGLRLGLLAVRKMVDLLGGGCGLTAWRIAPLDPASGERLRLPASWVPRPENRGEWEGAVLKLRSYFGRMGFRRVGRSGYCGLSMMRRTPSLAELLRSGPAGGGGSAPVEKPG